MIDNNFKYYNNYFKKKYYTDDTDKYYYLSCFYYTDIIINNNTYNSCISYYSTMKFLKENTLNPIIENFPSIRHYTYYCIIKNEEPKNAYLLSSFKYDNNTPKYIIDLINEYKNLEIRKDWDIIEKKCLYDAYCYRFKNEDILHNFVNKYKNYKFIYKSNDKKLNNINNNIINKFIKKIYF